VLGRIAPEKGQMVLVEAARFCPHLEFTVAGGPVIAGRGYFEAVRAHAGRNVRLLDWTEDVGSFFQEIDLLVVPSERDDANPRVILEAFAAGIPVLAFDSGGISELIEHGVTGLMAARCGPEELGSVIRSAAAHPQLLNEMADRAHACWRSRFTLERFQSEVCEAVRMARMSANT
jgi:glycosyltransferase involved in cell wall biosynthesis